MLYPAHCNCTYSESLTKFSNLRTALSTLHTISVSPQCVHILLFGSCNFLVHQFLDEALSGPLRATSQGSPPKARQHRSRGSYWLTGIRSDQTLVFLLNIRCFSWISILYYCILIVSATVLLSFFGLVLVQFFPCCTQAAAPDILIRFYFFHCSLLDAAALSVILTRIKTYPAGSVLKH